MTYRFIAIKAKYYEQRKEKVKLIFITELWEHKELIYTYWAIW